MAFIQGLINFFVSNKAFIVSLVLLIISEVMALVPSLKSNGILDFIINLLKKAQSDPAVAVANAPAEPPKVS